MPSDSLRDPEFLPFQLDLSGQRVLFVRLNAQQRETAAFLDQRALPKNAEGIWVPLSMLPAQPSPDPGAAVDGIFHIGHCGSTLLSRLLDTWPEVEGLREPLPLRTLAEAWRTAPVEMRELLLRLMPYWQRPLPPRRRVVIKATSSCNALIEPWLRIDGRGRAVLLDMPLQSWLATLLKSENSLRDVVSAAEERTGDLQSRGVTLDPESWPRDIVEVCAMGWLAEQLRFAALMREEDPARILRVDFEELLANPEAILASIAGHLELAPEGIARALDAPTWGRYSKAQQHDYGRVDRDYDLALAKRRFAAQIAAGRGWVDRFLHRHPQCGEAAGNLRFE